MRSIYIVKSPYYIYQIKMALDVRFKNLIAVVAVLGLLIAGVIGYYFTVTVGAIALGTVANVGQSSALNLSVGMTAVITGTETAFASNVTTANAVVPIAFSLVSLLAIMMIFNFNPLSSKGSGGKSVQ